MPIIQNLLNRILGTVVEKVEKSALGVWGNWEKYLVMMDWEGSPRRIYDYEQHIPQIIQNKRTNKMI